MNTLSREIARRATEWCEQNAQGTPVAWEWEDKFAELNIRECARVADTSQFKSPNYPVSIEIENHFDLPK